MHYRVTFIKRSTRMCFQFLQHCFVNWTQPSTTALILGTVTDLARSKSELVAENALLRQQLIILRRHVKRPACTKMDRMLLVLLARVVRTWKQAHITCPTRDGSRGGIDRDARLFWKYKSRAASHEPKIPTETIALIKEMAVQNRLWGAEHLRGEFLKVGLHVSLPHDPEIYETGTYDSTKRPELEDLLAQPCQRDLGLRRVSQSLTSSSARFSLSSSSNCTRGG